MNYYDLSYLYTKISLQKSVFILSSNNHKFRRLLVLAIHIEHSVPLGYVYNCIIPWHICCTVFISKFKIHTLYTRSAVVIALHVSFIPFANFSRYVLINTVCYPVHFCLDANNRKLCACMKVINAEKVRMWENLMSVVKSKNLLVDNREHQGIVMWFCDSLFVFRGNYKHKMLFVINELYVNQYINPGNTTRNWLHNDKWKCENVRLGLYSHLWMTTSESVLQIQN